MHTRKNFKERVDIRRKEALERLQKRLELSDSELKNAKRFRHLEDIDKIDQKNMEKYRTFRKNHAKLLEEKVKKIS